MCRLVVMADDLFSIKNEFYLGNYQGAINEAQSSDLELSSPNDERDRDVIVSPMGTLFQKRRVGQGERDREGGQEDERERNHREAMLLTLPLPGVPVVHRVGGVRCGAVRDWRGRADGPPGCEAPRHLPLRGGLHSLLLSHLLSSLLPPPFCLTIALTLPSQHSSSSPSPCPPAHDPP